jgi:hypothetical protein
MIAIPSRDVDFVRMALEGHWPEPTAQVKEKIIRNLRRQACDPSNPGLANLAARTLAELGRRSDHALEFAFKARLAEQVGPQSWSAWLAEPEPEVSGNVTTPAELPYTERANGIQPQYECVIPPRTDVQDESTPSGPASLEEINSQVLARYAAYLKGDEAMAEESTLPDDHEERLRQARFGYLSGR